MSQYNVTLFEEGVDTHPIFWQQDGNADVTGDWIKMQNYGRMYALCMKLGVEDIDTQGPGFKQASDNAGTGSKALNLQRCWYKTGTMTAAGQGVWIAGVLTTADDILATGSAAPSGGTQIVVGSVDTDISPLMILAEIREEDFDVAGGFRWWTVFMDGTLVDNACLWSALAIGKEGKYPQSIPLNITQT